MIEKLERIADGLAVFREHVTVGVVLQEREATLIDCGSGAVLDVLAERGYQLAEVLATHYHRDSCWAIERCRQAGAVIAVPDSERALFEEVDRSWSATSRQFHRYDFRPTSALLPRGVLVDRGLTDGDTWSLAGLRVTVVATPGHTDGSLSFVVASGGRRCAFVGDLLFGDGQVWEMWSLQGPPPDDPVGMKDYHAFCGRGRQAVASLERLLDRYAPDLLVPAHGPVIRQPRHALGLLRERIEALLANYMRVSSMRYYFPDWTARQCQPPPPPVEEHRGEPPPWYLVGETPDLGSVAARAIVAPSGRALVLDCGSLQAVEGIARWLADGTLSEVAAVWISHYHDDHVGGLGDLIALTGCAVWAGKEVADLLERPATFALPCLDPTPCAVDRVLEDGEQFGWEGFTLTACAFPGQTLYHSALLVDRAGASVLVAGDAFTPGGIDDYCSFNRNLLGQGRGYLRCLDLIEHLAPSMLVNMHIRHPFVLGPDALADIRASLQAREVILADLLPWADPNFGLDPLWAHCTPYCQRVQRGSSGLLALRVWNHSREALSIKGDLLVPSGWTGGAPVTARVAPGQEAILSFGFTVPATAALRREVLCVRVRLAGRDLGPWSEGMVDVISSDR